MVKTSGMKHSSEDCSRVRERLSEYLDRRLDAKSGAEVKRHVEGCASCRQELAGLQRTVSLLGELPMAPVPRSFLLTEAQVRQPVRGPWWRTPVWWRAASAVATLFLAVLLAGDYLGVVGTGIPASPLPTPVPAVMATAQPTPEPTQAPKEGPPRVMGIDPTPDEPTPEPAAPVAGPTPAAPDSGDTLAAPAETGGRSLSLIPWEIALGCVVAVLGAIAFLTWRRTRAMVGRRR